MHIYLHVCACIYMCMHTVHTQGIAHTCILHTHAYCTHMHTDICIKAKNKVILKIGFIFILPLPQFNKTQLKYSYCNFQKQQRMFNEEVQLVRTSSSCVVRLWFLEGCTGSREAWVFLEISAGLGFTASERATPCWYLRSMALPPMECTPRLVAKTLLQGHSSGNSGNQLTASSFPLVLILKFPSLASTLEPSISWHLFCFCSLSPSYSYSCFLSGFPAVPFPAYWLVHPYSVSHDRDKQPLTSSRQRALM